MPCLAVPREDTFIGVKTGNRYTTGYLVFLGKEITAEDILKKLNNHPSQADRCVIESFLSELQGLKIGNVVSLRFTSEECCRLTKTDERPVVEKSKRTLP